MIAQPSRARMSSSLFRRWIDLLERFYRVGSLVWGGGPVVLPLLLREVVPRFVTDQTFLQGFAFVQAMPRPALARRMHQAPSP